MLFTFNYAVAQDYKVNLCPCYSRYQNYQMMKTPAPRLHTLGQFTQHHHRIAVIFLQQRFN